MNAHCKAIPNPTPAIIEKSKKRAFISFCLQEANVNKKLMPCARSAKKDACIPHDSFLFNRIFNPIVLSISVFNPIVSPKELSSFALMQKNQKIKASSASLLAPYTSLFASQTRALRSNSDALGRSVSVVRLTLTSEANPIALAFGIGELFKSRG